MGILRFAFISVMALCLMGGCAGNNLEDLGDAVEVGVTAIGGVADESAGSGFIVRDDADPRTTCSGRAVGQACSSGVRSITYSGCTFFFDLFTLTGTVSLTYSDTTNCDINSDGESVVRTKSLTITGPRGGTMVRNSTTHNDYRGTSMGGGGKLTKNSSGWLLDILGVHHTLSSAGGQTLFDVSIRTTSSPQISGSLTRTSRVITGGALEVNHNTREFTVVWVPTNLTWNASCCYPVSGSVTGTATGSVTGTVTVTFSGCGTATVEKDGKSKVFNLNFCE